MTPLLQPLPVGIQDVAQLRERGCLNVDKTELVHCLVTTSTAVFLSRPGRFGKSLHCSVFQNLYEGRNDLLTGLCIEDRRNLDKRHPVVRISFGTGKYQRRGDLLARQRLEVDQEAQRHGVDLREGPPDRPFAQLTHELSLLSEKEYENQW